MKKAIQLLIEGVVLEALDRLGQSQGLARDSVIEEACRYYLARMQSARSHPPAQSARPELELDLLERRREAAEAERDLLILQYERAIPEYPLRDPGALEWDIRRLERDIAQLRAQIAAKRLELAGKAGEEDLS